MLERTPQCERLILAGVGFLGCMALVRRAASRQLDAAVAVFLPLWQIALYIRNRGWARKGIPLTAS